MAKYDANGRPIYETAEEYNRAHGTGASRHTYDSPEGANYRHTTYTETRRNERAAARYDKKSTVSSPKNTKKIVLVFVIIFIFLNMGVIMGIFNALRGTVDGIYNEFDEQWIDFDEGYGEYIGDSDTPLPEDFNQFTLDGVAYAVPMSYQELMQMGFTLEEAYDEDYTVSCYDDELVVLNGDDGYMAAMARFVNDTDEDILLSECVVDYFYLESEAPYDEEIAVPDAVFANGFTMDASYEELEAYFGVPYYQYIEDDEDYGCYERYEWVCDDGEEYHCFMVTFWDGVMADISIEKYEY